jgi:hypothetical protein
MSSNIHSELVHVLVFVASLLILLSYLLALYSTFKRVKRQYFESSSLFYILVFLATFIIRFLTESISLFFEDQVSLKGVTSSISQVADAMVKFLFYHFIMLALTVYIKLSST